MSGSLPPLTWFRAFEASARHLNFTAAAAEIGLTQSAVSQQIKSLETRLRATLFIRLPRGLRLTDEGRKLLPQVEAALETLSAATEHFDAGPRESLLTVSASISVIEWIISPELGSFLSANPGIRVRFLSAIWPDEFKSSQADVEIRFGSERQAGTGAIALRPSTLVAVKSPTAAADLNDLPRIEAVGTSVGWKAWCEQTGHPMQQPRILADSYGLAMQLASQGNGVALVSEALTGHALRAGLLVLAHPARIAGKEGYHLSCNQTLQAALNFSDWLLERSTPCQNL